jgi:alkylation response protein AidB-like acyl-CoA dehydrogenase
MNFDLSDDQRAYQQAAHDFAAAEMAPHAAEWDAAAHFPIDVIKKAGEMGFCAMYCPPDDGGMGLSRLDAAIILEELAAACPSTAAYISIHNMVAWMTSTWGSAQLKSEWAGALTSGQKLSSYCLTEPGNGSDAGNLKTRAEKTDDGWRLTGAKAFISGAGATDYLVVMARSGGAGPKGISAFAVDAKAEGIGYGRKEEKMGWNSQPTRGVTFDNVFVPDHHLLGHEGEGFTIAMKGLNGGRINIAACSLGGAQAAYDAARSYVHTRQQFGQPLAGFQTVQFKIADMATRLTAARSMVHRAAAKLDAGAADAITACAMAKQFASDQCFDIVNDALQLHGGYGYTRDYPVERLLRDLRVHQILEGTNEIMRLIVSRSVLEDAKP